MTEFAEKKAASEKRIQQYLLSAQRDAHQSIGYGNATIEELDRQNETFRSIEQNLDSQEEIVNQSLRKLRGMTWSGTFYNVFSDVASTISSTISSPAVEQPAKSSSVLNESQISTESTQNLSEKRENTNTNTNSTTIQSEEDKMLEDIANAASVLKQLGLTMGKQLEDQNQQLENIEQRTDQVHDKTLAVSIRASQLTQKHSKKDRYIGCFQFMNTSNSSLLCVDGDNLALTDSADPSTIFRVILRQDTIVGLQSEKTGKFVGITMWGSIAVSGNYFGSQEECFLELTGNQTGILFIAKNWGAGGWLKAPVSSDSSVPASTSPVLLQETTKSADDRENRMIIKAMRC